MRGTKHKDSESFIYLDKETEFQGSIRTSRVVLEGTVRGSVHASEEIRLKPGSVIQGNIYTGKILIEEGAAVNSEISMSGGRPDAAEAKGREEGKQEASAANGSPVASKAVNA